MRAVRLMNAGGPLVEQVVDDPVPGPGEVLVDVRCAGICHSDGHYRGDPSRVRLPITLGHEIAGIVAALGEGVTGVGLGDRVALHYLLPTGEMLGKERDGGFAEQVVAPAANAVHVPDEVPLERAAIMMCSTATVLHALRLAALRPGESVAILGFGGLGVSALQLLRCFGARRVFVVERVAEKRRLAEELGATAVDAAALRDVGVALDFAGHGPTTLAALRGLGHGGRLLLVAINLRSLTLDPYADVLGLERRIVGCSDHTREELVELMELARTGALDLSGAVSRTVPLEASAIDAVLDELERGTAHLRTVVTREAG
jgi:propanol-preferring alcohol dehydrogenase